MTVDAKTGTVFLPISEFEAVIPKGEHRPPMKPGTFGVLVVGK